MNLTGPAQWTVLLLSIPTFSESHDAPPPNADKPRLVCRCRLILPGLSCEGERRRLVGSKALPEGAIEDAKTVDLTYAGWMSARFSSQGPEGPPGEPRAEQQVLARTFHGVSLNDEFDWLKAANWREVMRDPLKLDSAIRAYLQAENDYCERALGETAGLQQTLFAEMKARVKEDNSTVPEPDGPYAYYVRYRKEGQHPLLCRQPRRSSVAATGLKVVEEMNEEQLLLDGDALAQGKAFFRLGVTEHSPDHRLLVWLADEAGSELYTAHVRVIESGADLADVVPDASGTAVWTQDASALFYVRLDQDHRPAGVFRHRLGTPVAGDVRVFARPDPGLFISIGRHSSGRFANISAHDHETSEVWLVDPAAPHP